MEKIKCPHCGYEGSKKDFLYMYESTLYVVDNRVEQEERERPVLIICPRCRTGFFAEDPYALFHKGFYKVISQ